MKLASYGICYKIEIFILHGVVHFRLKDLEYYYTGGGDHGDKKYATSCKLQLQCHYNYKSLHSCFSPLWSHVTTPPPCSSILWLHLYISCVPLSCAHTCLPHHCVPLSCSHLSYPLLCLFHFCCHKWATPPNLCSSLLW